MQIIFWKVTNLEDTSERWLFLAGDEVGADAVAVDGVTLEHERSRLRQLYLLTGLADLGS